MCEYENNGTNNLVFGRWAWLVNWHIQCCANDMRERKGESEGKKQTRSPVHFDMLWKAYMNVISFQLKNASQALFLSTIHRNSDAMLEKSTLLTLCDAIYTFFTIDSRLEVPNSCATCNSLSSDIDKLFGTELDKDFTTKSEFDSAVAFFCVLPSNCILALSLLKRVQIEEEWKRMILQIRKPFSSIFILDVSNVNVAFLFNSFQLTSIRLNGSEPKPKL